MKPESVAIAEDEYGEKLIRVSTQAQVRARCGGCGERAGGREA